MNGTVYTSRLLILCLLAVAAVHDLSAAAQVPLPESFVSTQQVFGDTLREEEAVRLAIDASPAARAARARLMAARAAAGLRRGALLEAPEAELSTTLGPSLFPEENDQSTEATVSVTLERPTVRRARRAAATAEYEVALSQARLTLDALVFEVRATVATLAAEEALARLAATLQADADTLTEGVALRFRVGDASELDLRLARLDAVRAAAASEEAAGQAFQTRARLAALLGVPAQSLPPAVSGSIPATGDLPTFQIVVPLDSSRMTPALAAARAETAAAEAEANYAQSRTHFPTFTLRGGLERRRLFFGPEDLDADPAIRDGFRRLGRASVDVLVGVSFPLPFGSPARREADLAAAEAAARAAEAEFVAAEVAVEAESARRRLLRAEAVQARYRSASADITESLYLLRLAYSGGEMGLEDLIAGRARLYESLASSLRADADVAQARLALARALGTLSSGLRLDL